MLIEWLLLGPDWKPRGRLLLPPRLQLEIFRGCSLYGLELDKENTPSVIRYDIHAPAGAQASSGALSCVGPVSAP